MQSVQAVQAIAGAGLDGDRYATGKGTFSGKRHNLRHVTLIGTDDIDEANAKLAVAFTPAETRRNIIVSGRIDLLGLIGREFMVGGVKMRGIEHSYPCELPPRLAKKSGFIEAFAGRGGLRAEILGSGPIRIGDPVQELPVGGGE